MSSNSKDALSRTLFELDGEAGTRRLAERMARVLKGGVRVGLSGGLGAGKTTLTRLLVAELGGRTPVSSPSYVLQHEYATTTGLTVEHWDLYRLSDLPEELQARCPDDRIQLIEWPERAPELVPLLDLHVSIGFPESPISSDQRVLTIEKGIIPDL